MQDMSGKDAARRTAGPPPIVLDLLAGFAAILFVVGVSVRAAFVGSDLRVMFAVSAAAFYGAGVLRGRTGVANVWLKGLVVSCPGLLGTGALIMNDGLHRLPVPIGISIVSVVAATAGVQTRRWWLTARRRSVALIAIVLLAVIVGIPMGVPALATFASLHRTSRPAPGFALTTSEGVTLRSQDMSGQVVVLAFWATWCLPCRWELPELQASFDRLRGEARVRFLAVDVAWGGETRERAAQFLSRRGLTVPVAFDAGHAAGALHVDSLPTVVVIDGSGRVRMVHHGYDRSEQVGAQIERIVRGLLTEQSERGE
jgi:thiol-disulfide isomerase/thioredoxin